MPVSPSRIRRTALAVTAAILALPIVSAVHATAAGAVEQPERQAPAPLQWHSDRSITGTPGLAFGSTVSQESCDVNGNGIPDLAAGNSQTFDSSPGAIGAYVLLDVTEDTASGPIEERGAVRILDSAENPMGGVDVRCAGDVNGDSFDDLAVVAQGSAVYIVFGAADFREVALDGLGTRGARFTGSVTRAIGVGDVTGDGRADVAVTDTSGDVTLLSPTEALGQGTLKQAPGVRISGQGIDLVSASRAGDVNGDGRADLLVGAPARGPESSPGNGAGTAWVLTDLKRDIDLSSGDVPGFRIDGPARGYDLIAGSSVGIGDIDGDGFDDLLLGGDSDEPLAGSGVVVRGSAERESVSTHPESATEPAVRGAQSGTPRGWWINGIAAGDHFGHAVGAARMQGWSVLLIGGMDGALDAAPRGAGYVAAIDSRALVTGALPLSASGVLNAADLPRPAAPGDSFTGGAVIGGTEASQHLGRSFGDLTADPRGSRVTFTAGAPASFTWNGEVPSVRILSFTATRPAPIAAEAPAEPAQPGSEPASSAPGAKQPEGASPTTPSAPAASAPAASSQSAGSGAAFTADGAAPRSTALSRTGAEDRGPALMALAGLAGLAAVSGAALMARRRH